MNPSLTYLTLNDFKPGIIQRLGQSRSGFGPAPLGAAAANGTYRCFALPGGGLAPLPRRTFSMIPPDTTTVFNGATQVFNSGFKVYPKFTWGFTPAPEFPIRSVRNTSDPTSQVNFYMGHEFVSPATPTEQRIAAVRHNFTGGAWTIRLLELLSGATANITNVISPMYFVMASHDYATALPGAVVAWYMCKAQDGTQTMATFSSAEPDELETPTGFSGIFDVIGTGIPIAHQGRIVVVRRAVSFINAVDNLFIQSDNLMDWSRVLNLSTIDTFTPVTYFPEAPYGIGAWASVSASDLFLVQHHGGAVLLQGDLNNPLVRRLPSVPSTNGSECLGIMTQAGFAYGVNRGGVYVWQGGDGAELLSGALDQDFWMPAGTTLFQNFQGQFATIGDFLFCSNNWVYSFTSQSWWRLEDADSIVMHMMDVDPTSAYIYGTPVSFNPGDTPAVYGFRQDQGATSYKWTSQPIFISDTKEVTVDEIILTVQGSGTVTITVNGDACTFDNIASPTTPVRIRLSFGKRFDIMQIVIDSTETTGGIIGAPVVYDVKFGIREKITLPVAA